MRGAAYKLPRLMNNGYDSVDGLVPMQQMTAAWTDYSMCGAGALGPSGLTSHMVSAGGPGVHVPGAHLGPVAPAWSTMYSVNNNNLAPAPESTLSCAHQAVLAPSSVAELQAGVNGPLSPYTASSTCAPPVSVTPGVAAAVTANSAPSSLSIDGGPLSGSVVPPGPNGGVGKPAPGKVNRKASAASKRRRGSGAVGSVRPSSRSPSSLMSVDDASTPGVANGGVSAVPALSTAVGAGGGGVSGTPTGSHKSCVVCSDRAVNNNFGQITCESCKAFFRRNAHKMEKLNCTGKGRCQITTDSRKNCPRCRLEKCFHMGMRKELIQVRKNGSAPKWLEGNSPDSGSGGSAGTGQTTAAHSQASLRQSHAPQQQQPVPQPQTGPISSSRPLSVGSSTEGSPAVEVGHLVSEQVSTPFHLPQSQAQPAPGSLSAHLSTQSQPLGASSPVAAAVCISPRQRAPTVNAMASGLTAFDCPAPEFAAHASSGLSSAHAASGGGSGASASAPGGAGAGAASNGFAAMFSNGTGAHYGTSELSSSLRIFRDLVGPTEEEMRSITPEGHPLLHQMDSLVSTLFENFSYNHPVNLEGLALEFEASWGLEFAVLVDILLRQLIHFLRHNDVTKNDSMRQDIEAIKAGLMNALPIFLALNYDRASGNFRFSIDGQVHEVSGMRLENALASIDPPETDILKYLVRYNTSVAALLHHKRDLFGLYLLLKIMTPTELLADATANRGVSSHNTASWSQGVMQTPSETQLCRYTYKDVYELLSRALKDLNQTEANTLSEMLLWSQGFDKAFRKAFSMKLSSHQKDILPKLVSEFVNPDVSCNPVANSTGRRIATTL